MQVKSFSFAESFFATRKDFLRGWTHLPLKGDVSTYLSTKTESYLLVFPAHLALLLAFQWGDLEQPENFADAFRSFKQLPYFWHDKLLQTYQEISQHLSCYLVPGTLLLHRDNDIFNISYLISPQGKIIASQRQIFLSLEERSAGLTRGTDLEVVSTPMGQIGIMIGTDAWYPETGRILALKGAEIICHCGALPEGKNHWLQLTGMWQQVQQNQFFCVECQLVASIAGKNFQALSYIHAPCEMTPEKKGVLATGGTSPKLLEATLDKKIRQKVIDNYPLLKLLNPAAYEKI